MVIREDLDILARFDADGGLALSLYLDVSTPERRESALDRVRDHLHTAPADAAAALAEDLDMVDLYLSTTTARRLHYIAMFSCARQLFWRAYPLDGLSAERIHIGARFDIEPLRLAGALEAGAPAPAPQADLLLQR